MDAAQEEDSRKRISTACEACRIAKTRCKPSVQPGVCQKCLDSKRECVSRTGPRTRRPRRTNNSAQQNTSYSSLPPPPKPSGTFTIDFEISAPESVDENFETLRESHASALEHMFPDTADNGSSSHPTASAYDSSSLNTPVSSGQSYSIDSLHSKPRFNIASAEALLQSFQTMIDHFPCINLARDATVSQLASSTPFVLLAILAAASGSRTLQGHNLYDEEFRKVLGLKIIAGGESSLELLQGLLIYCAWYPFHLRPRNKQIFQYLLMAADLVHTLDLEVDPRENQSSPITEPPTEQMLDNARAYLAYCYITYLSSLMGKSHRATAIKFTAWTSHCCELLHQNSSLPRDPVLAALVRLSMTGYESAMAIHEINQRGEQQTNFVLLGLEAQKASQLSAMPPHVTTSHINLVPVRLQSLFVNLLLDAGSMLRLPRRLQTAATLFAVPSAPISLTKLYTAIFSLKAMLELLASLDEATFLRFVTMDWAKLILSVILALRLSFPIPKCPEFDDKWARSELGFDKFLDKFSMDPGLTATSRKVDVLSASRVIVGIVKGKYQAQLAAHEARVSSGIQAQKIVIGCPLLDGSLKAADHPIWNQISTDTPGQTTSTTGPSQVDYGDLWTTMTMGWVENESMQNFNNYDDELDLGLDLDPNLT